MTNDTVEIDEKLPSGGSQLARGCRAWLHFTMRPLPDQTPSDIFVATKNKKQTGIGTNEPIESLGKHPRKICGTIQTNQQLDDRVAWPSTVAESERSVRRQLSTIGGVDAFVHQAIERSDPGLGYRATSPAIAQTRPSQQEPCECPVDMRETCDDKPVSRGTGDTRFVATRYLRGVPDARIGSATRLGHSNDS